MTIYKPIDNSDSKGPTPIKPDSKNEPSVNFEIKCGCQEWRHPKNLDLPSVLKIAIDHAETEGHIMTINGVIKPSEKRLDLKMKEHIAKHTAASKSQLGVSTRRVFVPENPNPKPVHISRNANPTPPKTIQVDIAAAEESLLSEITDDFSDLRNRLKGKK